MTGQPSGWHLQKEGNSRQARKPWGDLQCWRVFLWQEVTSPVSLTLGCPTSCLKTHVGMSGGDFNGH